MDNITLAVTLITASILETLPPRDYTAVRNAVLEKVKFDMKQIREFYEVVE